MIWNEEISFDGFQKKIDEWYKDKDFELCDPPISAQFALDLIFKTLVDDREDYPYLTTKEVTLPLVVGKIIENEIRQINFEANNGGDMYKMYVDEKLKEQKYKCSCTSSRAPGNMEKMSKIIAYSDDIKRNFIFLDEEHRSKTSFETVS